MEKASIIAALRALDTIDSAHSVMVIGDTIIDEIVDCDAVGLAAEAPAVKVLHRSTTQVLGGAAGIAVACASLGCRVTYVTDVERPSVISPLLACIDDRIDWICIHSMLRNSVTVKRRYYANRGSTRCLLLYVCIDERANDAYEDVDAKHAWDEALDEICNVRTVVIADYRLGMFTHERARALLACIKGTSHAHTIVTSQMTSHECNLGWYNRADVICGNVSEIDAFFKSVDVSNIVELSNVLDASVCMTCGGSGVELVTRGARVSQRITPIECSSSITTNTIGAGDAFVAGMAACLPQNDIVAAAALATCVGQLRAELGVIAFPNRDDVYSLLCRGLNDK